MKWYVLLFYLGLFFYLYLKRKEFKWIGPVFGKKIENISPLESFVKKRKKIVGMISIVFIILMFAFSIYSMFLITNYLMISLKEKVKKPGVTIVIPGFRAPGTEIEVPLIEGIIAIFILAAVHEISHAIIAIHRKFKIKSIGYGFLLFLPIAFTELEDEKELLRRPKDAVYIASAGPAANFLVAAFFLVLLFLVGSVQKSLTKPIGLEIIKVEENARKQGLAPGMIITQINGTKIENISDLKKFLSKMKPGGYIEINTTEGTFIVKTRNSSGKPVIGIYVKEKYVGKDSIADKILPILNFFVSLFYWIYLLNFTIGLLNAYPLPFLDGSIFWASIFKIFIRKENVYNKVVSLFITLWTAIFIGIIVIPLVL